MVSQVTGCWQSSSPVAKKSTQILRACFGGRAYPISPSELAPPLVS